MIGAKLAVATRSEQSAPHIGNVGTNDGDEEADGVYASGLIIKFYNLNFC